MIGIITYDKPHKKTQDLVTKLLLNGHSKIILVCIPFINRKQFQPLFEHRPNKCVDVSVEKMAKRLNINVFKTDINGLNDFFINHSCEHILIGGAGILPNNLTKNHNIINSHPGYLPHVKGLDALKWAIYDGMPIGVTTHYISDKVDEGKLIEQKIIPIYFEDSFHSLAQRLYETEIEMLVNSIKIIENNKTSFKSLNDDTYVSKKRMSHHYERIMIEKFEEIRKKSKSFKKV